MPDALSSPEVSPTPPVERRRSAPRWVYFIALLVPVVWLERRVVTILASADPAYQARGFLRDNVPGMMAIASCAAAWFVVRRYNEGKSRRLSYLAVCAGLIAVLNPFFVNVFLRMTGFHRLVGNDGAESAFRAALVALAVGYVAKVRIARSGGASYGGSGGTVAIAIGVVGAVLGVVIVIALVAGMRGH
jgi:hypothetical protein